VAKKSATKRQAAGAAGRISIGGDVHAGRDVIMGDQYNDFRQQVAQISSPAEFVEQAKKLQEQLAAIKEQPGLLPEHVQTIEVVEGDVQKVVEEAQKPKPLAARMTATLTGAKAVMDSLGESVKSALGLGAVLAGLAQIALKVFGG
jgi:hypothetical protein